MNQDINALNTQKANIALEIKKLEEMPKAKLSPLWMTLVYILAIASVGIFFFKPVYYIVALAILILTVFLGVLNLIMVKTKNKKVQTELTKLKAEERQLVSLISAQRNTAQFEE